MSARWRERLVLAGVLALVYAGLQWWRSSADDRWADEMKTHMHGAADIVMYSTQSCVYCARARSWFEAHRVPFVECDIERNAGCQSRYQALGAIGTPTFEVRGQRLIGFSAQDLAQALSRPTPAAASAAQP